MLRDVAMNIMVIQTNIDDMHGQKDDGKLINEDMMLTENWWWDDEDMTNQDILNVDVLKMILRTVRIGLVGPAEEAGG